MNVISLSKKKYEQLNPLDIPKEVFNTEALIKNFAYKRQPKIIKSLYTTDGEQFATKLYTIQMLDDNKEYLPENFYIPDNLLSVSNKIVGFTVPYASGINLASILKDKNIGVQEQVNYLKKIGELLEKLQLMRKYSPLKSFYLNDLHESNFLVDVDNKTLGVVDLDSCKIGTNNAFASRFLTPMSLLNNVKGNKYIINKEAKGNGHVIANEESDIYCYIIIILNYLFGRNTGSMSLTEFFDYLNYLDILKVNKDLLKAFEKIVVACPNENPVNYLEELTPNQVYRAHENVYKLRKK